MRSEKKELTLSIDNECFQLCNKNEVKEKAEEINIIGKSINKRYKNLVECYLCEVDDCQLLFGTIKELDDHKKIHLTLNKCDFPNCNKTFMNLINLKKHLKVHLTNRKKYICPFLGCKRRFSSQYSYGIHARIHTTSPLYQCTECGKKFFNNSNYQYHIKNLHQNDNINNYACLHQNCVHKSKSRKQLLMHHDKLEVDCVKEKNLLLKLIIYYQNASLSLLTGEQNIYLEKLYSGMDGNENFSWINEIKYYNLDNELKKHIDLLKLQSENIFNNSMNKEKYQGILLNF